MAIINYEGDGGFDAAWKEHTKHMEIWKAAKKEAIIKAKQALQQKQMEVHLDAAQAEFQVPAPGGVIQGHKAGWPAPNYAAMFNGTFGSTIAEHVEEDNREII